jgi:glutathione S-transferase/GST-like protein
MMMHLYHWEPNAACARVLIALTEKGLEFQSHYVDVLAFEQHRPEFLKLNAMGETPVLVQGDEAFTESSYICEYLDELEPERPLMPKAPLARWKARAWQKYVDDYLAASISDLAWAAYGQKGGNFEAVAERVPVKERRDVWTRLAKGLGEDDLDKARERVRLCVEKMEADLAAGPWLAGDDYSLADIAVYAYAAYLPKLTPELVDAAAAPRSADWLKRMGERPAVRAAMGMGRTRDPFATAAPGPEHVRWG